MLRGANSDDEVDYLDPSLTEEYKQSFSKFMRHCRENNRERIKQALEQHPEFLNFDLRRIYNTVSRPGTPLFELIHNGYHDDTRTYLEGARTLLALGADPRAGNSIALTEATSHGDLELVCLLLEKGADVNAVDAYSGDTPLHYAALGHQVGLLELLLQNDANPNTQNKQGKTPLMSALEGYHPFVGGQDNPKDPIGVLQALLDTSTHEIKPDFEGNTPLHKLVSSNIPKMIGFQTVFNTKDIKYFKLYSVYKRLFERASDPFAKNHKGESFVNLMSDEFVGFLGGVKSNWQHFGLTSPGVVDFHRRVFNPANQPRNNLLRAVFDVDKTVAVHDQVDRHTALYLLRRGAVIIADNVTHFVVPGMIELVKYLARNPNVRFAFNSAGNAPRIKSFVEQFMQRCLGQEQYAAIKDTITVCTKEDLQPRPQSVGEYQRPARYGLSEQSNEVKNLESCLQSGEALQNTILIDDAPFIYPGQHANLLKAPGVKAADFAAFADTKVDDSLTFQVNAPCYYAQMFSQLLLQKQHNPNAWACDMLFPLQYVADKSPSPANPSYRLRPVDNHLVLVPMGAQILSAFNAGFKIVSREDYFQVISNPEAPEETMLLDKAVQHYHVDKYKM